MTDLSHIPALLAEIGEEVRSIKRGHGDLYDVEVQLDDGTVQHSNLGRFLPRRNEHMTKVCRWLSTRPGNRVASVTLRPTDCSRLAYVYVVVKPFARRGDHVLPALLREQAQ